MKRKRMLKKILVYMLCLVMVISGSMTALATNTVSGGDVIALEEQVVTVCSTCNTFPCVCEPTEDTVSGGDVVTGEIEEVIIGDGGDVITDSSDDAVCEVCAKNPCICEEKAAKLESLMQMLPQGAEVPADCTEIYTYTAEEGSFEVVVCAPEEALPEGAELVAELLEEESDAYAQAEATIAEEHEYDGMVALDIHFELNGEEVEPEKAVYVCMNVVGLLPENAVPESVAVHHIAETETNLLGVIPTGTATSVEVVADSTEETGIVEVGENAEKEGNDVVAAFNVDGFSTFPVTYTLTSTALDTTVNTTVVQGDPLNATVKLFNYDAYTVNQSPFGQAGFLFYQDGALNYVNGKPTGLIEGSPRLNVVDNNNGLDITQPKGKLYYHVPIPLYDELTEDGYPKVKAALVNGFTNKYAVNSPKVLTEDIDLAYLFDGEYQLKNFGKSFLKGTMENGGYLFQKDEKGYYEYDSLKNAAYFNGEQFLLYSHVIRPSYTDEANVIEDAIGNFLPFNNPENVKAATNRPKTEGGVAAHVLTEPTDLWLGMTVEFDFYMPKDGKVNGEDMVFEFKGDDDVFVFIDDKLVLDLGGDHEAWEGTINFQTGEVVEVRGGRYPSNYNTMYNLTSDDPGYMTDVREESIFANVFSADELDPETGTFEEYTQHTLKFFYLERGGNLSYCKMRFNMPTLPDNSLTVAKDVKNDPEATGKNFNFEIELKDEQGEALNSVKYVDSDGETGEMLLTEGKGTFTLADSEYRTFNLKTGYSYTVTELDADKNNYKTTWNGDLSGTLSASAPVTVTFVNTLQHAAVKTDKQVSGTTQDNMFLKLEAFVEGDTVGVDENTILRDTISDNFQLDTTRAIKVYTAECTGYDTTTKKYTFGTRQEWSKGTKLESDDAKVLSITGEGRVIEVTGFDYEKYSVASDENGINARGRKIIVEIPIKAADDNFGGVKQETNDDDNSGLYNGDTRVKEFPDPYADITTTVTIQKNVIGDARNEVFEFQALYDKFTEYEEIILNSVGDSNYLSAMTTTINDVKTLKDSVTHNDSWILDDVIVGSTITIKEEISRYYNMSIEDMEITYLNDSGKRVELTNYTLNNDGTYTGVEITVLPGMEITFVNTLITEKIRITKTRAGSDDLLSGAQFKLESVDANTRFTEQNATTNSNGIIEFEVPYGTYTLTEISAPLGYALLAEPFTIEVDESGIVYWIGSTKGTDENKNILSKDTDLGVYVWNIENVELYELPSTGGSGTYWYTISGLMLMLGGALIMHRNKYKEVLRRQ